MYYIIFCRKRQVDVDCLTVFMLDPHLKAKRAGDPQLLQMRQIAVTF